MKEHQMNITDIKAKPAETVVKAVTVFRLVADGGLLGLSLKELTVASSLPRTTVYRHLCTWEHLGWLKSIEVDGRSELWAVSDQLLALSHRHRRLMENKMHEIKESYSTIAGEAL